MFSKAKETMGPQREELLESASEMIENNLILVGAVAVEDKLQKGVRFSFTTACVCMCVCPRDRVSSMIGFWFLHEVIDYLLLYNACHFSKV